MNKKYALIKGESANCEWGCRGTQSMIYKVVTIVHKQSIYFKKQSITKIGTGTVL